MTATGFSSSMGYFKYLHITNVIYAYDKFDGTIILYYLPVIWIEIIRFCYFGTRAISKNFIPLNLGIFCSFFWIMCMNGKLFCNVHLGRKLDEFSSMRIFSHVYWYLKLFPLYKLFHREYRTGRIPLTKGSIGFRLSITCLCCRYIYVMCVFITIINVCKELLSNFRIEILPYVLARLF